jgi:8-oxo-dGTP diphosphatase
MKKQIAENFGGALRLRACGILVNEHGVLMVRHQGLTVAGYLWAPPGGGMSFGQSARECLEREFYEETGLIITVGEFLFVNEFHASPLHALELFFKVQQTGGHLKTGYDPELGPDHQIIDDVKYFQQNDIEEEQGPQLHSIFRQIIHPKQLLNLKGYFQNWK